MADVSHTQSNRKPSKKHNGQVERVDTRSLAAESSPHRPARPLFGALPVARLIPMDVHSVMDYAAGAIGLSSLFTADTMRCRIAGAVIGAQQIGVSLLTDYDPSLAKVIPIEIHEIADYMVGVSLCLAPFVLGYWNKDVVVSSLQIGTGVSVIVSSLLTDYRASRGVGAKLGKILEQPVSAAGAITRAD